MGAIGYLVVTKAKNRLKQLLKSPGQLVVLLLMVALLGFLLFSRTMNEIEGDVRPMSELMGLAMVLYGFLAISLINQGIANGATFFKMNDVNLMFSAPITPVRVLTYGLFSQMGTALFAAVFLLFQYGWLHNSYGVTVPQMIVILLGYALVMFVSQLFALAIYSYCGGSDRRKAGVKLGFYIVVGVCIVAILACVLLAPGATIMEKLTAAAGNPVLRFLPIFGWCGALVEGLTMGMVLQTVIAFVLLGGLSTLLILFISRNGTDFYEDVLTATEISFKNLVAAKEGKTPVSNKKTKTGKTGLTKGWGANVFFYKHMLEDRRQSIFMLDAMSLVSALGTVVFALFMGDAGKDTAIVAGFCFAVYMQIFASFTGRWLKELLTHYVYLIPEPPFKKLINLLKENLIKTAAESVLVMVAFGLVVGANALEIITLILTRFAFSLLLIAINIFCERFLSEIKAKWLVVTLYFIFVIVFAIPGIALAIIAGAVWSMSIAASFLLLAAWIAAAALVILFCNRNILQYVQLDNK